MSDDGLGEKDTLVGLAALAANWHLTATEFVNAIETPQFRKLLSGRDLLWGWSVYPGRSRQDRWFRWLVDEALGVRGVGVGQDRGTAMA